MGHARTTVPPDGWRKPRVEDIFTWGNLTAGAWRVNVELPTGQLVGQLRFNVAIASSTPPSFTRNID